MQACSRLRMTQDNKCTELLIINQFKCFPFSDICIQSCKYFKYMRNVKMHSRVLWCRCSRYIFILAERFPLGRNKYVFP